MDTLIIITVILSVSALLGGIFMKYVSAKDAEMKTGFRTERAKLSPETWQYANTTLGKSWIALGTIYLVLGVPVELAFYYFKGDTAKSLGLVYCVFFVIYIIDSCRKVSDALRYKFDDNGNPIEEIEE